jgi:hypothetical protein
MVAGRRASASATAGVLPAPAALTEPTPVITTRRPAIIG